jgi:hypothetical protein
MNVKTRSDISTYLQQVHKAIDFSSWYLLELKSRKNVESLLEEISLIIYLYLRKKSRPLPNDI